MSFCFHTGDMTCENCEGEWRREKRRCPTCSQEVVDVSDRLKEVLERASREDERRKEMDALRAMLREVLQAADADTPPYGSLGYVPTDLRRRMRLALGEGER